MTELARAQANYPKVFYRFFHNALVRELSFRSNFWITLLTRLFWFAANLFLFELIYRQVDYINDWSRTEYYGFMATGMLINATVEAFFMPNCANFSEMIRTGTLDFALVKPIDTQFLVSLEKMDLSMVNQIVFALGLLMYSVWTTGRPVHPYQVAMYALMVACAVAFFYSLMIALSSTSIFFGRNQGLLEFWFYVTVFARYPGSIYSGSPTGELIRFTFSYVLPILLVVTVPARGILSMVIEPDWLAGVVVLTALVALIVSRLIFKASLSRYRSASS